MRDDPAAHARSAGRRPALSLTSPKRAIRLTLEVIVCSVLTLFAVDGPAGRRWPRRWSCMAWPGRRHVSLLLPSWTTDSSRLVGDPPQHLRGLMRWYRTCLVEGRSPLICPELLYPTGAPLSGFSLLQPHRPRSSYRSLRSFTTISFVTTSPGRRHDHSSAWGRLLWPGTSFVVGRRPSSRACWPCSAGR